MATLNIEITDSLEFDTYASAALSEHAAGSTCTSTCTSCCCS